MKKFHMIGILTVILAWVASTPADVFWANTGTDFNSASSFTNLAGAAQAPTSSDFVYFASCAVTQPILTSNLTIKGFGFSLSNNYATATNDGFNGYNFSGYNFTAQNGAKLTLGNSGSAFAILSQTYGTNVVDVPIQFSALTNVTRTIRANFGRLDFNKPFSTLGLTNTLGFSMNNDPVIYLNADNSGFRSKASFDGSGYIYMTTTNALLQMTAFSFSSWGATGSKCIHLVNNTGSPLNFSMLSATCAALDGLDFVGQPFLFSNALWTCEFRESKPFYFNARTVIGNFASASNSSYALNTGLRISGTNSLELLGDFCSATVRTNYLMFENGLYIPRTAAGLPATSFNRIGTLQNGTPRLALFADFPGSLTVDAVPGGFVSDQYSTGFAAYGGDRTVSFKDGSKLITNEPVPSSGSFYYISKAGNILSFGSSDSDGTIRFVNPFEINGGKQIFAFDSPAEVEVKLLGEISRSSTTECRLYFNKLGCEGTIELLGQNTYGANSVAGPVVSHLRGGRLLVSGSLTNHLVEIGQGYYTYDKTLYSGSILAGTGTVACTVNVYSNSFIMAGDKQATGELKIRAANSTYPGSLSLKTGAGLKVRLSSSGVNRLKLLGGFSAANKAVYTNEGPVSVVLDRTDKTKHRGRVEIVDWSSATAATYADGFVVANLTVTSADPDFISGSVDKVAGDGLYLTYRFLNRDSTVIIIQ